MRVYVKEATGDFQEKYNGTPNEIQIAFPEEKTRIYVKEATGDFQEKYNGTPNEIQITELTGKVPIEVVKDKQNKTYEKLYDQDLYNIKITSSNSKRFIEVVKDKQNKTYEKLYDQDLYNIKIVLESTGFTDELVEPGFVKPGGWGGNNNRSAWKVINMADPPSLFKVIDSESNNIATNFTSKENAQKFIDYYTKHQDKSPGEGQRGSNPPGNTSSVPTTGFPPLPNEIQIDDEKDAVSLKIDKNFINSYGSKKAKSGSKYYPRTQWSIPAFENEEIYIVFNTPLIGDTASGKDKDDLDVDKDPEWENTQTIGFKMNPDHENNADMYKIGVSIGKYLQNDIFHRESGDKEYTDTKPGDEGIKMHSKIVIPRAQTFGVLVRHWNIDTKGKGKANGVHMEAYVDPTNEGKWQPYLEIDDLGQFNNIDPLINPNYEQKVQTRLDEAKPHWEKNIMSSKIRSLKFNNGKDFIPWKPTT